MLMRNFIVFSKLSLVLWSVILINVNAKIYLDFEHEYLEQPLNYSILHIGDEASWLLETHNTNFKSFFLEVETTDDIAALCEIIKDIESMEILVEINEEMIEHLIECWKNASVNGGVKLNQFKMILSRYSDLHYGTLPFEPTINRTENQNAPLFNILQLLDVKVGISLPIERFVDQAQVENLNYRKNGIELDLCVARIQLKSYQFLDYNSFSIYFSANYAKIARLAPEVCKEIILELLVETKGFKYRVNERYTLLIGMFFYQWGEKERIKVVLNHQFYMGNKDMSSFTRRILGGNFQPPVLIANPNIEDVPEAEIVRQYKIILTSPYILQNFQKLLVNFSSMFTTKRRFNYTEALQMRSLLSPLCNVSLHQEVSVSTKLSKAARYRNNYTLISSPNGVHLIRPSGYCYLKLLRDYGHRIKISTENIGIGIPGLQNVSIDSRICHQSRRLLNPSWSNYFWSGTSLEDETKTVLIKVAQSLPNTWMGFANLPDYLNTLCKKYEEHPYVNAIFVAHLQTLRKGGNCYDFKTYWNIVQNWARLHYYEVIFNEVMFSPVYIKDAIGNTWFKNISHFANVIESFDMTDEEANFISNFDVGTSHDYLNTCVTMPDHNPAAPVEFDRALTYPLQVSSRRIVHLFRREALAAALAMVKDETDNYNKRYKYYLHASSDAFANIFSNTDNDLKEVFTGVHVKLCFCDRDQKIFQILKTSSMNLGISLGFQESYKIVTTDVGQKLISQSKYVIIRVNFTKVLRMQFSTTESDKILSLFHTQKQDAIDSLNYDVFHNLRADRFQFKRVNPNITVYAQIGWPSSDNDRFMMHRIKLWMFLHDFSTQFSFPIFVYEAFDNEASSNSNILYGWWKAKNGESIGDASNYIDRQADYFNLTTQLPKVPLLETSTITPQIFIVVCLLFVFILCLLGLFAYRIISLRYRMTLSNKDIADFRKGIADSKGNVDDASGNIYSLPYKEDQYELQNWKFKDDQSCTLIGAGFSSMVYKTVMQATDKVVAVKVTKLINRETLQTFLREIKLMTYVGKHPNLLSLLGAYTKETRRGIVQLVFEYHPNGSLLNYLKELGTTKSPEITNDLLYDIYRFCKEISNGMDYLAEKRVIHGDLSARNVLLTESLECKICDFGLSRRLYSTELYVKRSKEPMPWKWMAVEALERSEFSLKSDVWSLGVTFWEIFSLGAEPYPGIVWNMEFYKALSEGIRLPRPYIMTKEIFKEILSCWEHDPVARPNANDFVTFFEKLQTLVYAM